MSYGAWEAIDASDDPETCHCVQFKHNVEEKHAMDLLNQEENHEVEVIPLVEVTPTKLSFLLR